jgi:hypothetical protein
MQRNRESFTFIELIIVVSILSLVSLTIYSTLANGTKIWQTVNRVLPEEDLQIFLDKFAHDIANTLKFGSIRFLGEPDRLEFACVVYSPSLNNKTVGKIIYGYDQGKNILYKWELDYSQVYDGQEGLPEQALKNIKSLKFQFFFYNEDKKEYLWADEWVKEKLPLAVRVELEFKDGSQIDKVTRTISIPVAS